jgi:YD repeat-containing protein
MITSKRWLKSERYIYLLGCFILALAFLFFSPGCSRKPSGTISEEFEFDKEGHLVCRITPDGSKIKYKYNEQGLPVEIDYTDGPVLYGYDAAGNRIWMKDTSGTTEYYYDAFDRLVGVISKHSPWQLIIYDYDPFGHISYISIVNLSMMEQELKYREFLRELEKKLTQDLQRWRDREIRFYQMIERLKLEDAERKRKWMEYEVKYTYDILGNLTHIDTKYGSIEYFYYPEKGQVERKLPNGINSRFTYSADGLLRSLRHENGAGQLMSEYRYDYNAMGKVTNVHELTAEAMKTTKYIWDARGYLKSLHLPDGNRINYEYDAMGNRLSVTTLNTFVDYKYDNFGRLTKTGDVEYEWDRNGNLMAQIERSTKIRFKYNARNLPSLVKTPGSTIRYSWDGDGNMIAKWKGKKPTYFLPNPLAPPGFTLAEFDKAGKIENAYLYADSLIGQRDINGKMKYFLEDGFNSIRNIVDMDGKIIGQMDYTPFADPILIKGDQFLDFRMAGERFLPEIKSYTIAGRLYTPDIGRYLTPNPFLGHIERPESFNKYAHECNAYGIFTEPRCNQTKKLLQTFENQTMKWAISEGLKGFSRYALKQSFADYGRQWGPLFEHLWGEKGWQYGKDLGTFVTGILRPAIFLQDLWTSEKNRVSQGIPSHSLDFWEDWGRSGLRMMGSTFGGYIGSRIAPLDPKVSAALSLCGSYLGTLVGEGAAAFGRFYGTRMDRLYWWWSPMKWIPQDEYLRRLSEQGKRQASFAAEADLKRKYKDDKRKLFIPPDSCPWCGDGGNGGGPGGTGGPFGSGLTDPFKLIESQLGGIKLDATAQFMGNVGNITGVVYDPEKQVLVLVGNEETFLQSIRAEDLAIALMSVFGPIPQDPQFSLDLDDPKNPRGKWLRAVYIPEQIIGGTEFGKALFEADWLLKQYSFGVKFDENGKLQERKSSVPGFKSTADLSFEEKKRDYGKERWARFWIVSDDMKLKQFGKSIYFDVAKMRVKAKKQVPDPKSPTGLKDIDTEDDPIATTFANKFTQVYDEIAIESPEFEQVRQLAKTVAIAKWMKQEDIPFDANWVNEYANKRVDTVGKITALSTLWEKKSQTPFQRSNQIGIQTQIHQLHLFGGVDLAVKPKYISDDGTAQGIQKAVIAKLREKVIEPTFDVKHNGRSLKAVILPVTKSGQELWKKTPTTTVNGAKYLFNNQGKIVKSTDGGGNITEYVWDAIQRLSQFKVSTNNGWLIFGSKKNGSSEIAVTNSRQNKFLYRYSPSGYLREIIINGQRYAAVNYKEGDVTIAYANYVERLKYDKSGHIKQYETYPFRDGAISGKSQVLDISYDKDGNITEIHSPDIGHAKLAYSNGNLMTVGTSRGKIDYVYEAQTGRITQVNTTWGESLRYNYKGKKPSQITYTNGDYHRDIVLEDDLPVEAKDNNGELTKYKYHKNRFLEQVTDPTGASGSYSYDEQNRIKTINIPDGSLIDLQYEWQQSKETKESVLKKIKVIHTASKVSSPITKREPAPAEKVKDISTVLSSRLEDIKEAGKNVENGLIIDLFVGEKDVVHANIADTEGNVQGITPEASKEIRKLLNITAKTHGKLGSSLISRWQKFYESNLSHLSKPTSLSCPDGRTVKIKPILIIKSNEVNYKYANLEKVPALADNFIIFIASKNKEADDVLETSAKDLVAKINSIPKLTQRNVAFIIRLPVEMGESERNKWYKEIYNLQMLIGKDNVLVDPSKKELESMLQNRSKDIIAIELTHTDRGILLKNDERYTSKDIKQSGDLSHIKYLLSGIGTCNLPLLEEGKFAASLRERGVGIVNGSYREISSDVALEKFSELVNILRNIEKYDLYPYHLLDIIDQRLGISGEGTTNLGRKDLDKNYYLG